MTVKEIKEQVRWSIDEESGSADYVDGYMDNIITAKITDAMRWISLYADASLLGGSDSGGNNPSVKSWTHTVADEADADASATGAGEDEGQVTVMSLGNETDEEDATEDGGDSSDSEDSGDATDNAGGGTNQGGTNASNTSSPAIEGNVITMPNDFVRLVRVRVSGWRKGVMKTISEDSDEYLMQTDDTAKADVSCPIVALIEDFPCRLELFPEPNVGDKVNITYTVTPTEEDISTDTSVISVPPKLKTAFIYYLAYLVMCAYNDVTKANTMLGVAKTQIGGGSTQTDAG